MSRRPDPTSLVAGLLVLAAAGLLLAGREDAIDVGLGWVVPIVGVLVGGVLLASGLARRSR